MKLKAELEKTKMAAPRIDTLVQKQIAQKPFNIKMIN